jgi:hypothetical protein
LVSSFVSIAFSFFSLAFQVSFHLLFSFFSLAFQQERGLPMDEMKPNYNFKPGPRRESRAFTPCHLPGTGFAPSELISVRSGKVSREVEMQADIQVASKGGRQ